MKYLLPALVALLMVAPAKAETPLNASVKNAVFRVAHPVGTVKGLVKFPFEVVRHPVKFAKTAVQESRLIGAASALELPVLEEGAGFFIAVPYIFTQDVIYGMVN